MSGHLLPSIARPSGTSAPRCTEDVLLSLTGRVALVGNATPAREFGALIDAYDVVIRFNNFRIAGFERITGTRTSYRCTSGWCDVEHRDEHVEFSPFTADVRESEHLAAFNRTNVRPVLTARTDIHPLIPDVPNPSTGLSLVQLLGALNIQVDVFGFDGFHSAHYWSAEPTFKTSHSRREFAILRSRPNVVVIGVNDTGERPAA